MSAPHDPSDSMVNLTAAFKALTYREMKDLAEVLSETLRATNGGIVKPDVFAEVLDLAADTIEQLERQLAEAREDLLWNAYNTGHVKNGRWTHMFMSDGEWLACECGFNPREPDYDDAAIRAAIPAAAIRERND